jgi:membrane protease YdiL (CAAX protease family)
LADILRLAVGGIVAAFFVFLFARILGLSLFVTSLVSVGASSAWWIIGYQRRSRKLGWESLQRRFSAIDGKMMLASIVGAAAVIALPTALITFLGWAGFKITDIPAEVVAPSNVRQLPLAILCVVILGRLAEELMFRGLLLDWLKQKMALWGGDTNQQPAICTVTQ